MHEPINAQKSKIFFQISNSVKNNWFMSDSSWNGYPTIFVCSFRIQRQNWVSSMQEFNMATSKKKTGKIWSLFGTNRYFNIKKVS